MGQARKARLTGSTFKDQQTTIIDVNQQIGSNYSELNSEGTLREGKPNYGKGQVTRAIADVDVDFVELVFTIPSFIVLQLKD